MAIWYPSVLSYKEFAQANSFIKDITRTVDNQSVTLNTRIDELISSVNKNNNLVAANTLQITSAVEQGFAHIAEINQRGFGDIVSSVQALQSDINFNFEQIIHELEYQNKILDSILTTIQSPFETKVKEYYRKGCDLDKGGILDKAIEYFNKSISLPTGDIFFPSFYQLGKIYLDRVESEYNAIDLKLASDNLRLANKYGSGILRNNPSFKPILADCKFYLSLSLFRQLTGNSSSEYENSILNEAIFFAKESIILNPLLSSSMYYLAKYYSYLGRIDEMLQYLKAAFSIDRNFQIHVFADRIFERYFSEISALVSVMAIELRHQLEPKLLDAKNKLLTLKKRGIEKYSFLINEFNEIDIMLKSAQVDFDTNTYFGLDNCRMKIVQL